MLIEGFLSNRFVPEGVNAVPSQHSFSFNYSRYYVNLLRYPKEKHLSVSLYGLTPFPVGKQSHILDILIGKRFSAPHWQFSSIDFNIWLKQLGLHSSEVTPGTWLNAYLRNPLTWKPSEIAAYKELLAFWGCPPFPSNH